jgi:hypothetical protein
MKAETLNIGMVAVVLIGILAIGITFISNIIKYDIVWL